MSIFGTVAVTFLFRKRVYSMWSVRARCGMINSGLARVKTSEKSASSERVNSTTNLCNLLNLSGEGHIAVEASSVL